MKNLVFLSVLHAVGFCSLAASPPPEIKSVLKESGLEGGFVVHLGSKDGKATAELRPNRSFQVQALVTNVSWLDEVRNEIRETTGDYGPISADLSIADHLPYIDNLVNLIVCEEDFEVEEQEILRVLSPLGKAFVKMDGKWKSFSKPWPEDIDEWTHYLHGADGNAVAKDTRVGPPRRLQWVGSPRWSLSARLAWSVQRSIPRVGCPLQRPAGDQSSTRLSE